MFCIADRYQVSVIRCSILLIPAVSRGLSAIMGIQYASYSPSNMVVYCKLLSSAMTYRCCCCAVAGLGAGSVQQQLQQPTAAAAMPATTPAAAVAALLHVVLLLLLSLHVRGDKRRWK